MYAIIRTGGKQAKVREGDVIDVERLRADGTIEFTPLLVVDDKGTVFSRREQLKTAKVEATVVGDTSGDKIDIFKYKAKTGYRRRQGHRQRYTAIEITKIKPPTVRKAAPADEEAEPASAPAAEKPAAARKASAAEKPAAVKKASAAEKPAAARKASAAEKPAATRKPSTPRTSKSKES